VSAIFAAKAAFLRSRYTSYEWYSSPQTTSSQPRTVQFESCWGFKLLDVRHDDPCKACSRVSVQQVEAFLLNDSEEAVIVEQHFDCAGYVFRV
jgi:hypothetical protein